MRSIFIGGLIAGAFAGMSCGFMAWSSADVPMNLRMAIGYLTMLIGLSTIFLALKRRRDLEQGGVIRFWPAFGLGLAISLIAGVVYALMWELTLSIIGLDAFAAQMIAMSQQSGSTPKEAAEMRAFFTTSYSNPLIRFPVTITEILPVGVLVSLVSAALLRNPRFMPAPAAQD